MGFNFMNVPPGPPVSRSGQCMPGPQLAEEVALAVLIMCLDPVRPAINAESCRGVNPALAEAYLHKQSTIPTYLGQGRSKDGLGLYRSPAWGSSYPCCVENAARALRRLVDLGHTAAAVATRLGQGSEQALLAALGALPELATMPAPPRPKRAKTTKAAPPTGTTAEEVQQVADAMDE